MKILKDIENTDQGLDVVCSGLTLDCEMVLVGIGLKSNSHLAEKAGFIERMPEWV